MTKKSFFVLISLAAVLLAGLGGFIFYQTMAPAGSSEKSRLTIAVIWPKEENALALDKELREFKNLFPHWEVEILNYEPQKLADGPAPGAVFADLYMIAHPQNLPPQSTTKAPAVWTGDTWNLYYNRALLGKAALGPEGADAPLWRSGKASLEDLKTVFAGLAKQNITPLAVGGQFGWPWGIWLQNLDAVYNTPETATLRARGLESLESQEWKTARQEWEKWVADGWVNSDWKSTDWPDSVKKISSGQAAFALLTGSLVGGLSSAQKANLGVIPFPTGNQASWTVGSVWYLAANAASESPIGTEKLIGYLTSPGVTQRLSQSSGRVFHSTETVIKVIPSITSAIPSVFNESLINSPRR